jgi:uncharacterized membrane protein YebE (DUF533 family)
MTDYMNAPLKKLAKDIVADGVVDAAEVKGMRARLYADGVIDRAEADFLFSVNDAVSGHKNVPAWQKLFIEALTDFVLKDEVSPGVVDEKEANYLISKIEADGTVDETELALLVNITVNAKQTTPKFQKFVLAALKDAILEDIVIDAAEVKMIRRVIYGSGGGAGADVSRAEADFLFELNDAVSGKKNAPSWKKLFVEAITKYVLDDEKSPGVVDDAEAKYLMTRISADGKVDAVEKALVANIRRKATKVSPKLTV